MEDKIFTLLLPNLMRVACVNIGTKSQVSSQISSVSFHENLNFFYVLYTASFQIRWWYLKNHLEQYCMYQQVRSGKIFVLNKDFNKHLFWFETKFLLDCYFKLKNNQSNCQCQSNSSFRKMNVKMVKP